MNAALDAMPYPMLPAALAHALVGLGCLVALLVAPRPRTIKGEHPARKPLKFAISIALFLATMGVALPMLSLGATARALLAWTLALTMVVEMVLILAQALRGTSSHFNVADARNAAIWRTMMAAIVVASLAMIGVAVAATVGPLSSLDGRPLPILSATAWRAAFWIFQLTPVTGFAMGGRMRHSVGGEDGGPGLPFVGWSVRHGDLRVAHFLAMHGLQLLPLFAWGLTTLALSEQLSFAVLILVIAVLATFVVLTLRQALAGRPLLRMS